MFDEMSRFSAASLGTVINRQNKTPVKQCVSLTHEAVDDFAVNTTIHGIKYAFEPQRRFIERCLWVASVALCSVAAGALVHTSLQKFYTNPTLTSIHSFTNDTLRMPFPAITFCNVNLVFRYKVDWLFARLKIPEHVNISRERLAELLPNVAILLRPNLDISQSVAEDLNLLQEIFEANNVSTPVAVKSLSQPCRDMVERCSWNGEVVKCRPAFLRRVTFNGYCCSFNYEENTNWTWHPDKDPYKLRSGQFGAGSGLRVLLNPMKTEYVWGSYVSTGFSMAVHRSGVIPEGPWTFITTDSETQIRLFMDFTDSDVKLKTVHPDRRRCIFYDERSLKTDRRYSREACVLECRAEAVMTLCNCVPFYFVKQDLDDDSPFNTTDSVSPLLERNYQVPPKNKSWPFCNLRHVDCLRKNLRQVESEDTIDKCSCWPQCTILSYSVGLSESNFEAVEHFVGDFYHGMNTSGRASINIFLGSQVGQLTKRDIIYTIEQLMSKLGGIFSLLLGCSFLTAMEVIYYAVLRYISLLCGRSYNTAP